MRATAFRRPLSVLLPALVLLTALPSPHAGAADTDPYFDRVAVITGTSSGLGRALAEVAAEKGMRLVLADIDVAASDRLAMSIRSEGGQAVVVSVDLADPAQRPRVIDAAMERFGRIDYLFNNAGYAYLATLEQQELDAAHRLFEVNYWAYVDLAQRVIPIMREQGEGTIVNVASILGLRAAPPAMGHYSATKHALVGLFRTAARELEADGIRVFVAAPGGMKTNITRNAVGPMADAYRDAADDWESPVVVADDIFEMIQGDESVFLPGAVGRE